MTRTAQSVGKKIGIGVLAGLLVAGFQVVGGGSTAHADDVGASATRNSYTGFQATDNSLWLTRATGFGARALPLRMMPGTSPSICESASSTPALFEGIIAVRGTNGTLHRILPRTQSVADTGFPLADGTSPSISQDCGYYAFHGATGTLWVLDDGRARDLGHAMMPGTNVAVSPSGRMVFHGGNGNLWFGRTNGEGNDMGFPLMAGTTPAISRDGVIAFHHGNGNLWIIRVGGRVRDTGLPMAAGASPVISLEGGFDLARIAFQGANGNVWTTRSSLDGIGQDNRRAVMPGTTPAISADAGYVLWHGTNGHLQALSSSDRFTDTGLTMLAGTSPA